MVQALSESKKRALRSASYWYAQLNDPSVTARQTGKWQQWHQSHADHQWAWQQVESLRRQMNAIPVGVTEGLMADSPATRRSVLKGLLLLAGSAATGWQLWHSELAEGMRADYHTATGQMLHQSLGDGSLLTLNTDSAANVRFDSQQRLIELLYGDIAIKTGHDLAHRPFRILTQPALLTALGTRFTVQQREDKVLISVREHAVRAVLLHDPQKSVLVTEGQSLRIDPAGFSELRPADPHSSDWINGTVSFSDQTLSKVISVLSQYHPGVLRCTPSVAGLRLSGTFPLTNIPAALQAIAATLPVNIQYITQYIILIRGRS